MKSDTTLKLLLDRPERLLRQLLGEAVSVKMSLPTELQGNAMRADLLLELRDGRIAHVELQGYPEVEFPYRMLDYRSLIRRKYRRIPVQFAIWFGQGPVAIASGIEELGLTYGYRVIDYKKMSTRSFLTSRSLNENLFGLLGNLPDSRRELARILRKIERLPAQDRKDALQKLLVVSGMRGLDPLLNEEMHHMPITYDLRDSLIVQKFMQESREEGLEKGLKRGLKKGREQGREEGREEGQVASARHLLTLLIKQRFGKIPIRYSRRIAAADLATIEQWSLQFVNARSFAEIFADS